MREGSRGGDERRREEEERVRWEREREMREREEDERRRMEEHRQHKAKELDAIRNQNVMMKESMQASVQRRKEEESRLEVGIFSKPDIYTRCADMTSRAHRRTIYWVVPYTG